jgi:hypothetical protein
MDPQSLAIDPVALATLEGAKITAEATARAAWVQAGAALGAIIAGALAYFGAVRQVRWQERAHEVRAVAYRFRLSKIVREYLAQIAAACTVAKEQQLARFNTGHGSVPITSFRIARPESLQDENWEIHALLGRRAVELILIVDDGSRRLAELDREIGQDAVRTDSHFTAATLKPAQKKPANGDGYRAREGNRRLCAGARSAAAGPICSGSSRDPCRRAPGRRCCIGCATQRGTRGIAATERTGPVALAL